MIEWVTRIWKAITGSESGWLIGPARTGIQALWGLLAGHFVVLQAVPADTVIEWVLTVAVIGGATAFLRWAESRTGNRWWEKGARWVAKVLMLGLSRKQPVYTPAPTPAPTK